MLKRPMRAPKSISFTIDRVGGVLGERTGGRKGCVGKKMPHCSSKTTIAWLRCISCTPQKQKHTLCAVFAKSCNALMSRLDVSCRAHLGQASSTRTAQIMPAHPWQQVVARTGNRYSTQQNADLRRMWKPKQIITQSAHT